MIHIQKQGVWTSINQFEDLNNLVGFKQQVDPSKHKLDHAIGFYTEKDEVNCGLSNCNHRHKKGVVIKFKSGDITNVGHICGKNQYGVEFSDSNRSINQSYNDHLNRKTLDLFKKTNPTFINEFDAFNKNVKTTDLYEKCASLMKGKYKGFPVPDTISEKIKDMVSNNTGMLRIHKKIKKGYMNDGLVHEPVYSDIEVGNISGLDFLFPDSRRHVLNNDIEQSVSKIDSIDDYSTSEKLKDAANLCGSILNQVGRHQKIINKGYKLLEKNNLELLFEVELNPSEKKQLKRLINEIAIE